MTGILKFKLKQHPTGVNRSSAGAIETVQPPTTHADPIANAMEQAEADVPKLLMPKTVAAMLGLTERTLERWRITGEGPRYVKLSRSTVRYLREDVSAFVTANLRANTAR